jgi:hypothetical protein
MVPQSALLNDGVLGALESDEILSISEVAGYLRCCRAHVYNVINGKLDGVSQLPAIQRRHHDGEHPSPSRIARKIFERGY